MSSGKILNEENFKQALEDIKKERAPLGFVPTHYVVNYTDAQLNAELQDRKNRVHICEVCHAPCGAGGCHGKGFFLKVSRELAERCAKLHGIGPATRER